jgi:hypothetical protein
MAARRKTFHHKQNFKNSKWRLPALQFFTFLQINLDISTNERLKNLDIEIANTL